MEPLTNLPSILEAVTVPKFLGVTQLLSAGDCNLKAVVSPSVCPKWPVSPEAEFGRVAHSLMDLAARGELQLSGPSQTLIALALDQLLDRNEAEQPKLVGRHYQELRKAFSQREWRKRTSLVVSRTLEIVRSQPPRGRNSGSETIPLADALRLKGFAASELALESRSLRLRARIDFLSVAADGSIEVTDFKSGNIVDGDGEIEETAALQLRLYGLAILELAPWARVELKVVSRAGTSSVSFSEGDIQRTRDWLATRISCLPETNSVLASELALIGPQCRGCRARAVCPVYRTAVADLWRKSDSSIQLPLDIAGCVLAIQPNVDGTTTLKIADLSGRIVKIHRLCPNTYLPTDFDQDSVFWFFNLASSEVGRRNEQWRHPRNFHELPTAPLERRAWTLKAYRTGPTSS